jgi:hypothetical protein
MATVRSLLPRSFVDARPRYQWVKDIGEGELVFCTLLQATVEAVCWRDVGADYAVGCGSLRLQALHADPAPPVPLARAAAFAVGARSGRPTQLAAKDSVPPPHPHALLSNTHPSGAFGTVFLAKDIESGQLVAIKELVRRPHET